MRIALVTGSLGAGKTTAACALIEALKNQEVVYVVNDAGGVAFDAVRVNAPATERLLAGCVCCEDVASLTKTLQKIAREKPHAVVLVEPSGLADPPQILAAIKLLGFPLEILHLHVINAALDPITVLATVQPSAFLINRLANENDLRLWEQSTKIPVISFKEGDSGLPLLKFSPLQLLLMAASLGTGHAHHGFFIQNLVVPEEQELQFLTLLRECSANGTLQRAKGKLSSGCVSATPAGVRISEDPLYEELPEGVMLVIGKGTLQEVFSRFTIAATQLDLLLEAYRNLAMMKQAPNTNAAGQLLVANDCDRAQMITYEITDPAVASALRKKVFPEMVRWRLASMDLLESCQGTPEEKLFWEHSLAAKLGYILGEHLEDISEAQQKAILDLQVFKRYFSTMKALNGVENPSFTMPTQHEEKPWVFWSMLRARATQYGEMDASTIDQIVADAAGRPEEDPEAIAFFEHQELDFS